MKENKKRLFIIVAVSLLIVAVVSVIVVKAVKTYRNLTFLLEQSNNSINVAVDAVNKLTPLSTMPKYDFDYSWLENNLPICMHAMGGIDDKIYTNSLEAFMKNYNQGGRIFEVDFLVTKDNEVVAVHDEDRWHTMISDDNIEFNSENFKEEKLFDKYTSLTLNDVLILMKEHPDIYIITDTKEMENVEVYFQFSTLVRDAKKIDPSILNRIIPQIYEEEMLYRIMDIYDWKSVIFTLYQTTYTPSSLQAFVLNSGVRCITMYDGLANQETIKALDAVGAKIGVHTVNDEDYAGLLISSGVDLVYSDFLKPTDFS